jgi:iron complex transport system substrate-binding protein
MAAPTMLTANRLRAPTRHLVPLLGTAMLFAGAAAAAQAPAGGAREHGGTHAAATRTHQDAAPVCRRPARDASRIAIAGGSLTEIVYLLGEEERIVGADRTSNWPAAALELPQIGYVRELSTEGVLSLSPTLVLGEHDAGPPAVIDQLTRTGVEVAIVPEEHTPDGIIAKVRCVAMLLGMPDAGEALLASRVMPVVDEIESLAMRGTPPRAVVLLGIRDGSPLGAGTDTSGAGVLDMARAENALEVMSGWKPVSMETMVSIDPDYIVLPARGLAAAGGIEGLVSHPAIRLTSAGRSRRIIAMDGMALLGFGPRTLEAARDLAAALRGDSAGARAAGTGR